MFGIGASMTNFGKTMIVFEVKHTIKHQGIAYENFYYNHTLAILPLKENSASIVITVNSDRAKKLISLSDENFKRTLHSYMNNKLGDITITSKPHSYPLIGVASKTFISKRFALIGDAAIGMHPVTAHGFNLGLQSVNILSNQLNTNLLPFTKNIHTSLHSYNLKYKLKLLSTPLYKGTNLIAGLYNDSSLKAKIARNIGLKLGNNFPLFKHIIQKILQ
jgi:2-polyprenyl-6-methoxyphenol hydroxylase-like FAD-dependent oxidoreductase